MLDQKPKISSDYIYKNRIGKFLGNKIFVYNEDEKNSLIENGIANNSKIIVTGCPRLDKYFKIKNKFKKK